MYTVKQVAEVVVVGSMLANGYFLESVKLVEDLFTLGEPKFLEYFLNINIKDTVVDRADALTD